MQMTARPRWTHPLRYGPTVAQCYSRLPPLQPDGASVGAPTAAAPAAPVAAAAGKDGKDKDGKGSVGRMRGMSFFKVTAGVALAHTSDTLITWVEIEQQTSCGGRQGCLWNGRQRHGQRAYGRRDQSLFVACCSQGTSEYPVAQLNGRDGPKRTHIEKELVPNIESKQAPRRGRRNHSCRR